MGPLAFRTALVTAAVLLVPTVPPAAAAADDATVTGLQWQPCPYEAHADKQCAWLSVPRRYDRPNGPRIRVALARIPATGDPARRIGSLVWDAGGPGGASTEMIDAIAARLSPRVRARFDFVAFDPRGIGASEPALQKCRSPWPNRPAYQPRPSWRGVQARSATDLAAANRRCLRTNRTIARVMGTNNVVRDLDRIRAALGDRQLTFWATSYGTRIGYVYALRHPDRVRAMVMDGNIDPTTGYAGLPRVGGTSQDSALRFLRTQEPGLYRVIMRTADSLTASPVAVGGGFRFSRWDWLDIVGDLVAFQDAWAQLPRIAGLVQQARLPGPDGAAVRDVLRAATQRPNSNEGGGFSIVNCLDYATRLSPARQVDLARRNAQRAPVLGGSLTLAYAVGCSGLRGLRPDPVPLVTNAAQRARLRTVPVLLANATHDGSTPMVWARRMQRVFDRPMIAYRSSQHVIWGATASSCVNRPIDEFVLTQRLPRHSRTCPFVPVTG